MSFLIELVKSVLFGIIQGITEWLPISSTGHLNLLNSVLPLNVFHDMSQNIAFWNMYKVVIQFGSILAVVILYFSKLNPFGANKTVAEKKDTWKLWAMILIASVPAGVVGILFDDVIDSYLSNSYIFAIALIVYGVLFILIENRHKRPTVRSIHEIKASKAVKIGCFQMLALIPGTSRSGSTILGATLLGLSRSTAAEFSFFMAIPVMFGASILKLIKLRMAIGMQGALVLFVGMFVSFVVSVIVIRSLLKYIRKHDFKIFGLYRIVFGILILLLAVLKILPVGFGV